MQETNMTHPINEYFRSAASNCVAKVLKSDRLKAVAAGALLPKLPAIRRMPPRRTEGRLKR